MWLTAHGHVLTSNLLAVLRPSLHFILIVPQLENICTLHKFIQQSRTSSLTVARDDALACTAQLRQSEMSFLLPLTSEINFLRPLNPFVVNSTTLLMTPIWRAQSQATAAQAADEVYALSG